MAKDAKGHGSEARGGMSVPDQHRLNVARQTLKMPDAMIGVMGGMDRPTAEGIAAQHGIPTDHLRSGDARAAATQEIGDSKKLEPFVARKVLEATGSHNQDFHALRSDQVSALSGYAKQFGYRKSASAPGSTARMFHAYLHRKAGG